MVSLMYIEIQQYEIKLDNKPNYSIKYVFIHSYRYLSSSKFNKRVDYFPRKN